VGSVIVTEVWPVAVQRIGPRTYFVFFAVNLVGVLLVALCFPETKGKRLEEMDGLFGGSLLRGRGGRRRWRVRRRQAMWSSGKELRLVGARVESMKVRCEYGRW